MSPSGRLRRALLVGAGISADPPASLPLGGELEQLLRHTCFTAAARLARGAVDEQGFTTVCAQRTNVLALLAKCAGPSAVSDLLGTFRVTVPNEAHLLAAAHAEAGTLVLTLNVDDGIERAHALLAGTAQLPADAPASFHQQLDEWRRRVRPRRPLRVATPRTANDDLSYRPLLVKLRGSATHGWDPGLVPGTPGDDPNPAQMSVDQLAIMRVAATARHLAVAGVSGADQDCRAALLELLRPGCFSWTSAALDADLIATVRRIDADQPVLRPAISGVRSGLPDAVEPPGWPRAPTTPDHFGHQLESWRGALGDELAAQTYLELLADAGVHDQATTLQRALRCRL